MSPKERRCEKCLSSDKDIAGTTLTIASSEVHRVRSNRSVSEFNVPTLRVIAGPDMLRFASIYPGQTVKIGRDESCQLVLSHGSVSRFHCFAGGRSPAPRTFYCEGVGNCLPHNDSDVLRCVRSWRHLGRKSLIRNPSGILRWVSLAGGAVSDDQIRVVLAKLGYDGHDRGIKVVARILRDAGMEVIYLGLRQSYANVVNAVEQEDADAVGLSMHNASHLTLAPKMVEALAEAELDVPVIVGGIIPDEDIEPLAEAGVAAILGPGASAEEVAASVRNAVAARA